MFVIYVVINMVLTMFVICSVFDMASSSSSSSSFDVVSGPRENDVLWMQNQHVSQHIWNGDTNRKLRMRRAISTYQGIEQPPPKIIHLL